jgi:hypothetical protein
VLEDMSVAAYGYPRREHDAESLLVFFLDRDGEPRQVLAADRVGSPYHGGLYPLALGVFGSAERDRIVLRVADPVIGLPRESWWVFRFSDGERIAELRPAAYLPEVQEGERPLVDACSIPGVPLDLACYYSYENKIGDPLVKIGVIYTVVDESAKPIWTLKLRGEIEFPRSRRDLARRVEHGGTILETGDRTFSIRSMRTNERVQYLIGIRENGDWIVTEVDRSTFFD